MYVSYPSLQSSMNAGVPTFVSEVKDSHTTPSSTVSVSWIHTRFLLTQIRLRPHASTPSSPQALLRNEFKRVINIHRSFLSAGFNDVPELIVKIMSAVYFYCLGPHITFFFSNWIFS